MTNWKSQSPGWQKRNTFAIVGFMGLALMYSLRFNLSIGIVAMVDDDEHSESRNHGINHTWIPLNNTICPALLATSSFVDGTTEPVASLQASNNGVTRFKWSEKDQGLILGFFFWGYVISQIPGGILASRLGGKWVVSIGLLVTGLLSLILPWAAKAGGVNLLLAIRFLQGVSEGVVLPSFMVLLAKWTPPGERASITTLCFSGMPFGTAMTLVISGHLISAFGWPAVFYVPGILTIVWFIAWAFLVYSSPAEHPTITTTERDFLESSVNGQHDENGVGLLDIPWKEIMLSLPVWAILGSHFLNTWGHNTLKAEGPKYLHSVLHFNVHEDAYIAAIPYLFQLIFCNFVVRLSDYLISKKWLSVLAARRLCNTIGQAGTSMAYLGLILADCNRPLVILFFILSGSLNGAVYGGFMVNSIDISPNYAGVIEGLINGIANVAGFGAPYVAGLILQNEPSIYGWRYVFLIPVIGDFIGNLCFVLFCSTEVQPWNNKRRKEKDSESH